MRIARQQNLYPKIIFMKIVLFNSQLDLDILIAEWPNEQKKGLLRSKPVDGEMAVTGYRQKKIKIKKCI